MREKEIPPYQLIQSRRKTVSIEITRDLALLVRAPLQMPKQAVHDFVLRHRKWIETHLERAAAAGEAAAQDGMRRELSPEALQALSGKARTVISERVRYYSALMELTPSAVKITSARTRFGSCSGKNSLCFSCRLLLYPEAAVDYVVVHELAHIRHKNHGREFYALIARYLPDYKERIALLKGRPSARG